MNHIRPGLWFKYDKQIMKIESIEQVLERFVENETKFSKKTNFQNVETFREIDGFGQLTIYIERKTKILQRSIFEFDLIKHNNKLMFFP